MLTAKQIADKTAKIAALQAELDAPPKGEAAPPKGEAYANGAAVNEAIGDCVDAVSSFFSGIWNG